MERKTICISHLVGAYHDPNVAVTWFQDNSNIIFSLVVWLSLWLLRSSRDPMKRGDLRIFATVLTWHWACWPCLYEAPKAAGIAFLGWVVHSYMTTTLDPPSEGESPWLLPSKTSHTRLFPKKHSFAYSYLQVAIPVSSSGRFGKLLSIGNVHTQGWFHVQASDYLERTSSKEDESLDQKLRSYLRSQGVDDAQWDHAYLITAPRFLGYSFNPVSFWYIYTNDNVLAMMILEVNNTFDERRMYLLHAKNPTEKSEDGNSTDHGEEGTNDLGNVSPSDGKFRNAWTKDFHVSPFNSRKGYYTLTADDPFHARNQDLAQDGNAGPVFSNTITLKSSKDHVKLVAHVFSVGAPLNPMTSTWIQTFTFIASWFWVGFMTFPRILKEAAKLFWARGLHVWLRPEVLPESIGRKEDPIENELAQFFEAYLEHRVQQHKMPIQVLYTSNLSSSSPRTISSDVFSNAEKSGAEATHDLELRILSPAFFTRFVHYAHSTEAFDRECVFTDEKNRTVWVSRPDLLYALLESRQQNSSSSVDSVAGFRWGFHKMLRCAPAEPAYPLSSIDPMMKIQHIRMPTFSPLDRYVMEAMANEEARYRRLCARLFLAKRVAFGILGLVDAIDFVLRLGLLWKGAAMVLGEDRKGAGDKGRWSVGEYALLLGVHLWAAIKGS